MSASHRKCGKASGVSCLWENYRSQEGQPETALHQILQKDGPWTGWWSQFRGCFYRGLCAGLRRDEEWYYSQAEARSPIRCSVYLDFVFVLDVILMSRDLLYLYCNCSTYTASRRRPHREIANVSDCGKKRNISSPTTSHNTIRRPLPPPGPSHQY